MVYIDVQEHCGAFPECSGSPDYAYVTAAVTLNDGKESMFYQVCILSLFSILNTHFLSKVSIFDSRGQDMPWGCPSNSMFNASNPLHFWFFDTNPYGLIVIILIIYCAYQWTGLDESLGSYGIESQNDHQEMTWYSFDILPHLQESITTGMAKFS